MTAERLREAAALMRARAEALEGRRWSWTGSGEDYPQYVTQITSDGNAALVAETYGGPEHPAWEAEHIASWSPAVALAVADWLEHEAKVHEASVRNRAPADDRLSAQAVAVAHAYLGGMA